jgi:hypothetical protein
LIFGSILVVFNGVSTMAITEHVQAPGTTWETVSNHIGVPPDAENPGSSPSLKLRPEEDFLRILRKGYKVIIRKGSNRFKLLQYLLGRYRYDPEGLHLEDYLVLFDVYYQLLEQKSPSFAEKLQLLVSEDLLEIMKKLQQVKIFPAIPKDVTKERLSKIQWIPSGNAYFGQKGQGYTSRGYRLVFNDTLVPRKFPPKAFIGVGYKDKGSRRNSAEDGSPSWQEIGTHFANQEREQSIEDTGDPPRKSEG